MKRNDRMLLKVLSVPNNEDNVTFIKPANDTDHKLVISSQKEHNKVEKKDDDERTDSSDLDLPVPSLPVPLPSSLLTSKKVNEQECRILDEINSPVAPLYSPLTPLVAASRAMILKNISLDGIGSPDTPLNSPLTPAVAASRIVNRTYSSPLPPMSPETFKLFETLNQSFPSIGDLEHNNTNESRNQNYEISDIEELNISEYKENFFNDQYSVPNNHDKSGNRCLKGKYVPESDSDSDDIISIGSKVTHAIVHYSEQSKIPNTCDNSIAQQTLEVDSNDKQDDQILHNNVDKSMETIDQVFNDNCDKNKTNCDEDLTDFSCNTDPDYVPDTNEKKDNDSKNVSGKEDTIAETIDLDISNRNECEQGRPKKGRKRKYPEHTIAQKKEFKYKNVSYNTKNKRMEPKTFRDYDCKCIKQCFVLVSQDIRKKEFEKYITLGSYEAQLLYILNNVKESPKTRSYTITKCKKTDKTKPRSFKRNYFICNTEVCKNMFLNTFQISSKKIDVSLKKNRTGNPINDQRGKAQGGWNKTPDEDVQFIKNLINSLPKYISHYSREQSDCKYLKTGMTIQKIYDIYIQELKNENPSRKPVSFETLKRIFYGSFNLRCKSLKKDTCNRCDALSHKIRNSQSEEIKLELTKEKEEHLKLAKNLRKRMNADLTRAKSDKLFECLTFDLEKTLPLPRIPTNIVFYKRQLWVYNSGIHVGSNNTGHCNVWVEGEAGRGAQEVGSCLINFIKKYLDKNVQELVLWSDSCGGQNRNIKIITMLKAVLSNHSTLKTITFKFLEPGHSFLPNDTDFSKIEYRLRCHERIYTPEEYISVMKNCKKQNPLKVYRMQKEDFLSVSKIEKKIINRKIFTSKEKVNWLKTKEILLKKECDHYIFMKTSDGPYLELDIGKKVKRKYLQISEEDFELLWPNGKEIAQAKLDDLVSMYDLIPKDCIEFYKSLRGNINIEDDLEGFGGEPDFVIMPEGIEDNVENVIEVSHHNTENV